jgi:hypothetical protein
MVVSEEYLQGVLKQILNSYAVLEKLSDKPGDLEILNREWLKIFGLFRVLVTKLENTQNNSDVYLELLKRSRYYVENNHFEREIDTLSQLYSTDTDRLKNIRFKILESLNDRKLIERIESIMNEL